MDLNNSKQAEEGVVAEEAVAEVEAEGDEGKVEGDDNLFRDVIAVSNLGESWRVKIAIVITSFTRLIAS